MIRENSGNEVLLKIACFLSLLISFVPAVDYLSPWYITVVPVLIVLVVTLNANGNVFPMFKALGAIVLLIVLQFWLTRRGSSIDYFINALISFLPCIVALQVDRTENNSKFFQFYLQAAACLLAVTSVTTIIGLEMYPMASRELASGTAVFDTTKYTIRNIGGYDFVYSLVIFIPAALCLIKHTKGLVKLGNIGLLVVMLSCIYASQYTIATVCAVCAFLVIFVVKSKKRGYYFVAAFVLFLLCGGTKLFADFFAWLSSLVDSEYMADRLLQVSQLLAGETVDTDTSTERIDHYMEQWEAFLESPIWGHNWGSTIARKASGHTVVLDFLGSGGLLALSFVVMLMRSLFRAVLNKGQQKIAMYVKAIWIMFFAVACLNPVLFSTMITIVFMCSLCINKLETADAKE